MSFIAQAEAPPLYEDADGALRVGASRVLLELVIRAFQDGATPEAIVHRYPTVTLSDVYATVAYWLRHRKDVEGYLAQRERAGAVVRERIEREQSDMSDLRDRLRGRRSRDEERRCAVNVAM